MKRLTIALFAISLFFISCSGDSDKTETTAKDSTSTSKNRTSTDPATTSAGKKYDVKSGIIHFETTIKAGGMVIVKKKILYFDEYGMKEAEEELNDDGTVEKTLLSDGSDLYLLLPEKKESYKQGKAYQGVAFRYDREGAGGKAKKVANINVAGVDADAYELVDDNTKTTNIFAGDKHINLYMKQSGTMNSETKATKVELDVPVPADKFVPLPSGYTAKTM